MKSYDVIIIGGGVIGNCVAYYLSQFNLDIALIEKGDIACGTSSRCDGNILINAKKPGFNAEMAASSQKLFKQLISEIPYDFEYKQRGSLSVIESEEELRVASDYADKLAADGYPVQMLDKYEVHDVEPYLAEDIIGGIMVTCDASLNPMAFAFGLNLACGRHGVDIYDHCLVKNIKLDRNGAIERVITDHEVFITKNVVNCAGVWASEIGKMVGIDIPIKPRQGQVLVAEKTFSVGRRKIMEFGYLMTKFGGEDYNRDVNPELEKNGIAFVFEPTQSDNFLIGSSRAFVGFDTKVSIEVMQGLANRAIRFFPVLKDINVIRAYAGLRPYVSDHMPIISQVKQIPGFYIAAGHEGDGISLSPLTGKLISQMIVSEEPLLKIKRLSFERFNKVV